MQSVDIYRNGSLLVSIRPEEGSQLTRQIMGEDTVRLVFRLSNQVDFRYGDYIVVFGSTYRIMELSGVKKSSTFQYSYSLNFKGTISELAKIQYLFLGADNTLSEGVFSLMGTADTFITLLVDNLNRAQSGWQKGSVDVTDFKNFSFNSENCSQALARLAEAFEREFWVEGKTIHLSQRSRDTGYTFKHGYHKGLYEIDRQPLEGSSLITRIYAFGSERNLPPDYRGFSRRLKLPTAEPFVQQYTATLGAIEHTQVFEDIYPRRTGRVTSVNATDPFVFLDSTMDFNLNDQLLPGATAKVVFNTGQLSGYQFEVAKYEAGVKQFTLLKNKEERFLEVPSENLRPAIGDQYVLVDIRMPDSYIDNAEQELLDRATQLLARVSSAQYSYRVSIDPLFLQMKKWTLSIGDEVWIVDAELDVRRRIRITALTRDIINEWKYTITLADGLPKGVFSQVLQVQSGTVRDVQQLQSGIQNAPVLNNRVIGDLRVEGSGSIDFDNLPQTADLTGFQPVYIEEATGRLFRKV